MASNAVLEGRIPGTVAVRFSLDETFDIGEDAGTPVAEDYVDKMPYRFTGRLKKVFVVLEPEKLSEEERRKQQNIDLYALLLDGQPFRS